MDMKLQFLDFDYSEDEHGLGCWDALASPAPAHGAALLAEVAELLSALRAQHGAPGPVDEGHGWDCDLQAQAGSNGPMHLEWHGSPVRWMPAYSAAENQRITLSLSLTGNAAFAHDLNLWTDTE
jgi:hypothetical protein